MNGEEDQEFTVRLVGFEQYLTSNAKSIAGCVNVKCGWKTDNPRSVNIRVILEV